MEYRFVSLTGGERDIHWLRLAGFALLTFTVVPATIVLGWYAVTGHRSDAAMLISGFISVMIVLRSVFRAYAIPEGELNPTESTNHPMSSTSDRVG